MNPLRFRPCVVWMLCLGLVLPGVGQAALVAPTVAPPEVRELPASEQLSGEEAREVPGTQGDAPRRLLVDEREQEQVHTGAPRGLRILGEVGGGLLTSVALGVVGGATGGFLCLALAQSRGDYDGLVCLAIAVLGAGVGAGLGLPLGTWWAGELLGGNGSLLASLGGAALGAVGGVLVLLGTASVTPRSEGGAIVRGVTLPLLTLAGSILGYELSQKAPRRWATRGGLQPLVSFSPSATVIGLGGSF